MAIRIRGRSSSHFTRITRVFAHELDVPYVLQPVFDLRSLDVADYAGNPALKVPILETDDGVWFGALNICRELSRRAHAQEKARIVWPEDLSARLAGNAQELVLHGMASEVALLMSAPAAAQAATDDSDALRAKSWQSLTNCLVWLERHLLEVLETLPAARDLSFFEVALFCFVTHLPFRDVADVAAYANLRAFTEDFAKRPSAQATPYYFDKP